ncbi:MAG: nuclear transport factor 2 family protein [Proteobacteria bacterium]|nr:nuclear transport factor 2 family protein [Pseudomonadota bacterium]
MTNCKNSSLESLIEEFITTFIKIDYAKMESLLTPDLTSYITNAEGGVDKVRGRDAYIERVRAMNMERVKFNIRITQLVTIKQDQGLVMVEIKADRNGKSLHNFAAFLINVKNNLIDEMWMVEALPAYSDTFWKED